MKVLILSRQFGGCQYYRQILPARALRRQGVEVDHPDRLFFKLRPEKYISGHEPEWAKWLKEHLGEYDVMLVDRPTDFQQLAFFRGFCDNSPNCRMIIDFDDDFINVPRGNPSYSIYLPGQEPFEAGLASLRLAEMTTLSTEHLARTVQDLCHNVSVMPNMIDPEDWQGFPVNPERASDPCFRVVYAGAAGHFEDLDIIQEDICKLIENQPVPLRFFMIGSAPKWMAELTRRYPHHAIFLPWHEFWDFPMTMNWGGFDLSIAPLVNSQFNRCKSNIKWLEAGVTRIPFLCSDVGPYKEIPGECVGKVSDGDWYRRIVEALEDRGQRDRWAAQSEEKVLSEWSINVRGKLWYDLVTKVTGLPRITSFEATRLHA